MPLTKSSDWPEGLSDQEAVQRLRTLCLGACDGVQDLADDARYKALRKALLSRPDLRPAAPVFVAAQPNLEALVRHLRQTTNRGHRQEMVRSEFQALQDLLQGIEPVSSAGWTGKSTPQQQAALVKALAPAALDAVKKLIDDEERARGNGGPVEQDREEALLHLKQLHGALGELIRLAQRDQPLGPTLSKLASIREAAASTLGKAASALPVTASALIAFGTVAGIVDFFCGSLVISAAAGTIAGTSMKDGILKAK